MDLHKIQIYKNGPFTKSLIIITQSYFIKINPSENYFLFKMLPLQFFSMAELNCQYRSSSAMNYFARKQNIDKKLPSNPQFLQWTEQKICMCRSFGTFGLISDRKVLRCLTPCDPGCAPIWSLVLFFKIDIRSDFFVSS